MKKLIYILAFLLIACGSDERNSIPEGILQKEKLIPIIVDLQILESHFQRQFSRVDLYRDALDSSSVSIFEEHAVSKETFSTSIDYYASTPDTLFTIYEAALDSIKFRMNAHNANSENGDPTAILE